MSTTSDEMMRAISPTAWGGAELLAEIETPRPVPGPTEILVRVHAAGHPLLEVGRVDAGGVDADLDLGRDRLRRRDLLDPQDLRSAELMLDDRLHRPDLRTGSWTILPFATFASP